MKEKQGGAVLLKGLGVVIGAIFLFVGVQEMWQARNLKRAGGLATVEPIAGYSEHRTRGISTYTAEFAFKTQDGRRITQRHSFPKAHIEDFNAGRPVKVYYDPANPTEFVFEKDGNSWVSVAAGIGIAIAALIFG